MADTKIYVCKECGYDTNRRPNLLRHLRSYDECAAKHPEMLQQNIIKKQVIKKQTVKNKTVNVNKGVVNNYIDNSKHFNINIILTKHELPSKYDLSPYPFPETDILQVNDVKTILESDDKIETYVDIMYFNQEKVQGKNVVRTTDKDKCYVFNGEEWIEKSIKIIIDKIFHKMVDNIEEFIKNPLIKTTVIKKLIGFKNDLKNTWMCRSTEGVKGIEFPEMQRLKKSLEKQIKIAIINGSRIYLKGYKNEVPERIAKMKKVPSITEEKKAKPELDEMKIEEEPNESESDEDTTDYKRKVIIDNKELTQYKTIKDCETQFGRTKKDLYYSDDDDCATPKSKKKSKAKPKVKPEDKPKPKAREEDYDTIEEESEPELEPTTKMKIRKKTKEEMEEDDESMESIIERNKQSKQKRKIIVI